MGLVSLVFSKAYIPPECELIRIGALCWVRPPMQAIRVADTKRELM